MTRVAVSLGDVSINKVPMLVAADQGIYARHGLDVHQTISPKAARTAAASGVVVPDEYVNHSDSDAPIDIGGGSPMIYRFVTGAQAAERVIVLSQESLVMGHVIARPGIGHIENLKGKRIGFTSPGSVTHFSALAIARHFGWSPDRDITLVGRSATIEALTENRVDAIPASAMIIARGLQAGFSDIGDATTYRIPMAGSGILVERAYLAQHRDTVLRFVKAAIEATSLMQRDRRVFDAALAKWFHITDASTKDGMFASVSKFEKKPYPSVDGVNQVFALYDSPEMRRHTPEQFYDSSLIEELDRSGFLDDTR